MIEKNEGTKSPADILAELGVSMKVNQLKGKISIEIEIDRIALLQKSLPLFMGQLQVATEPKKVVKRGPRKQKAKPGDSTPPLPGVEKKDEPISAKLG